MRILWDEARCASLGMCEEVSPETFEVGEKGVLVLLSPEPPESARASVVEAVAACPTGALRLEG